MMQINSFCIGVFSHGKTKYSHNLTKTILFQAIFIEHNDVANVS